MDSFVAASDLHGDRADPIAVRLFHRFVEEYKPRVRVFLGDLWDFRSLRSGADADEKAHSLRRDFAAGMEFLSRYRPHVLLLGNHDIRLWDLTVKHGVEKTGPMADLGHELLEKFNRQVASLRTKVLPYDKRLGVWHRGGLSFTHGFAIGVGAARTMAQVYGNVVFGHGHAIDVATQPGPTPRTARMVGCLCDLDMTYNRAALASMRQQHGWAYGGLWRNRHAVFQAKVEGTQVVYADRLRVLAA